MKRLAAFALIVLVLSSAAGGCRPATPTPRPEKQVLHFWTIAKEQSRSASQRLQEPTLVVVSSPQGLADLDALLGGRPLLIGLVDWTTEFVVAAYAGAQSTIRTYEINGIVLENARLTVFTTVLDRQSSILSSPYHVVAVDKPEALRGEVSSYLVLKQLFPYDRRLTQSREFGPILHDFE